MNLTEDLENTDSDLARLRDALAEKPNDSSLHFQLGSLLWDKGVQFQEKAAQHFLIAAKLDPLNGLAFKFLGHFYSVVNLDVQRAIKCFQRALQLNPDDSDSGEALCDLLDKAGKETLEVAICRDASEKSPRAFWAFRRLGYMQVYQNRWSEAVQSLQHAIRGYPACADLWEALGLAYQRLGMFTAAIKSYGRAIELDDTRVFALIESGNILLMLGSFRKGIDKFREALEILPNSVASLYGLGSALLGLSMECINLGAFKWGASILEEASKIAKSSTSLAGNMSSLWKLLGDVLLAYAEFLPWFEEGQSFDQQAFRTSIYTWKKNRLLAAISAKNSYQRALHLAPWQANIYADIAVTSDYISILSENSGQSLNFWQVAEKMALGALSLECNNHDFWVVLGCVSDHLALKQHALIRGLQLDISLATGWAYLGKIYREEGNKQLARQAFDCARSIDPSLALPWAGMSADSKIWDSSPGEAFESCLRAVQTLPHAEFQLGLAKLALQSGHLSSPQVFGAIQQAVQQAPQYPESHNLNGLVCEALSDYQSAAVSYRLARHAINSAAGFFSESHHIDISVNLARSLILGGNASDAIYECENLKKEGILDAEGLQIYAYSMWQLGQNDQALSIARNLAANIFAMDKKLIAASVSFICRLLYNISGRDSAISSILRMPKEFFQNPKVGFIVSAIHALDESNRLETVVSGTQYFIISDEEMIKMYILAVLGKLIKHRSQFCLGFQSGVVHLRKALHKYPNSCLIRNLLGYLLLCCDEWNDIHAATRCCIIGSSDHQIEGGLKSACDVLGASSVACYAVGNSNPKFSFPTCNYQCLKGPAAVQNLQKSLHQEPWKHETRFLLTLNVFQKAREERYPQHLCATLQRLILVALSNNLYSMNELSHQYKRFQLLLCASEISLQTGNQLACMCHATNASTLALPDDYLFFAHLLLCRAYAAEQNFQNAQAEYETCLKLKTDYPIGWLCLKILECQYELPTDGDILQTHSERFNKIKSSWYMWMAVFSFVQGLVSLWKRDYISAERAFLQSCSLAGEDSCLALCHGATCMELARRCCDSNFLSLAVRSLTKAQETSVVLLPIVCVLLAQAYGSLGSKGKWENNIRYEWYSWPPEMRPAELLFQMHLLARESKSGPDGVEFCQSQEKWVLRAIHINPSCSRYWKMLQKLLQ